MFLSNWFRSVRNRVRGLARGSRRRDRVQPRRAALRLETLEDRNVPTASLDWAFAIGGTTEGQVWGRAVATDTTGNVVMGGEVGSSAGIDFDPGPGVFTLTSTPTSSDGFIAKYAADGTFLWARQFEGIVGALAVDATGNIYAAAGFTVVKLDADGNELWQANLLPGAYSVTTNDIAVDSSGNVYVTGQFGYANDNDLFVAKLDSNGVVQWQHTFDGTGGPSGNSDTQSGSGIAIDSAGNVYVTGAFQNKVDFDPGPATHSLSAKGYNSETFVLKLDANGNYLWAKKNASAGDDIALDGSDNVIVMGGSNISKLTATGAVVWTKNIGAGGKELAIDAQGNIYAIGTFWGTVDFDPSKNGVFNMTSTSGGGAAYVVKLTAAGSFDWAVMADNVDHNEDIAVDSGGNVYATGLIPGGRTVDFDPGAGIYDLTVAHNSGYLWKLNQP